MDQHLIAFEPRNARATFACDDPAMAFAPIIAPIRAAIDSFHADVSTAKGRKEIASFAQKIVKSKTLLEGYGKEVADEIKREPKLVDAARRYVKDTLDAWRDEVRAPLDAWEAAEKERCDVHERMIAQFGDLMKLTFNDGRPLTADQLRDNLAVAKSVIVGPHCEEYEEAYRKAKDVAIATLTRSIAEREQYERDQAELSKLRAAEEERKARERAEQEARELAEREARIAAEAAERERARAIREAAAREAELHRQIEAERQQKEDAERRAAEAKASAEREAAQAKAREEEETRLREADKAHRGRVNREAVNAFVIAGIEEHVAKQVVTLIAKGAIPAVSIYY